MPDLLFAEQRDDLLQTLQGFGADARLAFGANARDRPQQIGVQIFALQHQHSDMGRVPHQRGLR